MSKHKTGVLFFLLLLGQIIFHSPMTAQEPEPQIREEVEVVNVEIPVRVFLDGNPVADLTRADFTLYEGGEQQHIHGFYLKQKAMGIQNSKLASRDEGNGTRSRYIVLVFRITSNNDNLVKGVDYLFDHLIQPEDELLVFINDRTVALDKSYWKIKRRDILKQVLRKESIAANQRLMAYFLKIKQDLDQTRMSMIQDDIYGRNVYLIIDFLKRYRTTWEEYKRRYLLPDMDNYYHFARHLEKVRKEKWVINFYQIEMFPKMKITGRLRQQIEQMVDQLMVSRSEDSVHAQIIAKLLEDIDRQLNVADDFPVDEIAKLMYKVDTTYHTVMMGTEKEALSQDLQFRQISTDIENCLREVTKQTGGALINSRNLGSALHTIGEKQDVYYVLTYAPKNPKKVGRIRIEVAEKKYKVIYNDNMRADYIKEYLDRKQGDHPNIKLTNLAFENRTLSMTLCDFKMETSGKRRSGKISVHVLMKDQTNRPIFDQNREVQAKKGVVNLSVVFDWLKRGQYYVVVDITDHLTGKTAMDFVEASITQ